jgi:hypothetical protein
MQLYPIVAQQLHEMELVRRKIFELEQAQLAIKAKLVSHPASMALRRSYWNRILIGKQIRGGYCSSSSRTRCQSRARSISAPEWSSARCCSSSSAAFNRPRSEQSVRRDHGRRCRWQFWPCSTSAGTTAATRSAPSHGWWASWFESRAWTSFTRPIGWLST